MPSPCRVTPFQSPEASQLYDFTNAVRCVDISLELSFQSHRGRIPTRFIWTLRRLAVIVLQCAEEDTTATLQTTIGIAMGEVTVDGGKNDQLHICRR
jgi:hypothetical protein